MNTNQNQTSQIFKFLVAGGITVVLYYVIMYTFVECLKMWYIKAATIAFIVNNSLNFILQKFWAFKGKNNGDLRKEVGQYTILAIGSITANCLLLYAFVEWTHLHYIAAQVVTTVILTVASYFVTRNIFRKP